MSKKLKRVKKMSQLKPGDMVLVVAEPEIVEVVKYWNGPEPVIESDALYAHHDVDLSDAENIKVYKLRRK